MRSCHEWADTIRLAIKEGDADAAEWLDKLCYSIQRDVLTSFAERLEDECNYYARTASRPQQVLLHITGKRIAAGYARTYVSRYEDRAVKP